MFATVNKRKRKQTNKANNTKNENKQTTNKQQTNNKQTKKQSIDQENRKKRNRETEKQRNREKERKKERKKKSEGMIDVSIGVALFGSFALALSVGSVLFLHYKHIVSFHAIKALHELLDSYIERNKSIVQSNLLLLLLY
jgi:hypothetical protein